MNKKIKCLIATGVLFTALGQSGIAAFATTTDNGNNEKIELNQTSEVTDEDRQELAGWLSENGVSEDTVKTLMDKFEKGEKWDSLTNGKIVKVEEIDENTQKSIYEDGSIMISGIQDLGRAISGGTSHSGSGYLTRKNAKVYQNAGVINAHFYATFTMANGGYDLIDSIRDPKVVVIGGTVSSINLKMVKQRENANGHAQARLSFIVNVYSGIGGGNCWLDLRVGNNDGYTRYSY